MERRTAEDKHLTTMVSIAGRRQGMCTCGWRSPMQSSRADAARLILDHASTSACRAKIGTPERRSARSVA